MKALRAATGWFVLFLTVTLVLEIFADPSPKPGYVGPWSGETSEWNGRPH